MWSALVYLRVPHKSWHSHNLTLVKVYVMMTCSGHSIVNSLVMYLLYLVIGFRRCISSDRKCPAVAFLRSVSLGLFTSFRLLPAIYLLRKKTFMAFVLPSRTGICVPFLGSLRGLPGQGIDGGRGTPGRLGRRRRRRTNGRCA